MNQNLSILDIFRHPTLINSDKVFAIRVFFNLSHQLLDISMRQAIKDGDVENVVAIEQARDKINRGTRKAFEMADEEGVDFFDKENNGKDGVVS